MKLLYDVFLIQILLKMHFLLLVGPSKLWQDIIRGYYVYVVKYFCFIFKVTTIKNFFVKTTHSLFVVLLSKTLFSFLYTVTMKTKQFYYT